MSSALGSMGIAWTGTRELGTGLERFSSSVFNQIHNLSRLMNAIATNMIKGSATIDV